MTAWTIEELSLLDLYSRGSRLSTMIHLEQLLPYLWDDPDMLSAVRSTIDKLNGISDMDFLLMMLEYEPINGEWEREDAYE